jgi:mannose-6-phosphate isomerase-like protein (cupin superfamily)
VNLVEAAGRLAECWSPRVVARCNDQYVKVVKVEGELVWHAHADEDELFQVLRGTLVIRYEDRPDVVLGPGDIHVVPRGVRHNPLAEHECWLVLIEPVATRHTGEVVSERTRTIAEQLAGAADRSR